MMSGTMKSSRRPLFEAPSAIFADDFATAKWPNSLPRSVGTTDATCSTCEPDIWLAQTLHGTVALICTPLAHTTRAGLVAAQSCCIAAPKRTICEVRMEEQSNGNQKPWWATE